MELGLSRPARGAWVEIPTSLLERTKTPCRAPQGARGLKYDERSLALSDAIVAPRKGRVG